MAISSNPVLGPAAFTLTGFLSPEECARFIEQSEAQGYEAAAITSARGSVIRTEVRNNERLIRDDSALAEQWFERARPFLPATQGQWTLCGLNERFRFYRYDPGQSFKRHYDGSFHRPNGEQSFLTLMVYLNADFTGGQTVFYDAHDRLRARVEPAAGMALVFDHQLIHEGASVESGRKYVLRTDVMFRRR